MININHVDRCATISKAIARSILELGRGLGERYMNNILSRYLHIVMQISHTFDYDVWCGYVPLSDLDYEDLRTEIMRGRIKDRVLFDSDHIQIWISISDDVRAVSMTVKVRNY